MASKRRPKKSAARADSTVSTIIDEIEVRNVPPMGGVSMIRPSGSRMRQASSAESRLDAWGE